MEKNQSILNGVLTNGIKKEKTFMKKKKKKRARAERKFLPSGQSQDSKEDTIEVEYVVADPLEELDMADPNYEEFARIFGHFQPTEEEISEMKIESQVEGGEQNEQNQEPEPEVKQMSKKEKKKIETH